MAWKFNPFTGNLDFDSKQSLSTLDARYVNVTGDSMTGPLDITTSSNPALSLDTGSSHITGLEVGDVNDTGTGAYLFRSSMVGSTVADYTLYLFTSGGWPELLMEGRNGDIGFGIIFDGKVTGGTETWTITTYEKTIRFTPGSGLVFIKGGLALNVVAKTGVYTATIGDHVITCDASGGAFTVTLPNIGGVGPVQKGVIFHIKKTDSSGNAVTIDGNSSETIDGATTAVITAQYESIMIIAGASEWHII